MIEVAPIADVWADPETWETACLTWLRRAQLGEVPAGETLIYHTGDLGNDRHPWDGPDDARKTLDRIAAFILADAEKGSVILSQRRLKPNIFEYRATVPVRFWRDA